MTSRRRRGGVRGAGPGHRVGNRYDASTEKPLSLMSEPEPDGAASDTVRPRDQADAALLRQRFDLRDER